MNKSYYIIENISGTTVIIPDLGVELKPAMILDLEKVARRIDIERSLDLIKAFAAKLIKIVKKSIPQKRVKLEKPLSESELHSLLEKAMAKAVENARNTNQPLDMTKLQETIQRQIAKITTQLSTIEQKQTPLAVSADTNVDDKLDALMAAIQNIKLQQQGGQVSQEDISEIDLEKLAELAQKGVSAISSEISGPEMKTTKKIKLNTNVHDLAKEIE